MTTLPNLGRVSDLGRIQIHGRPTNWTSLGRVQSSVSLDFTSASIDATLASLGFVFARASTATRINASGVMESLASGAMRIDHDPTTLACLGGLFEEAGTNAIRNSTMVGAAAGSPGTLPTNWTSMLQSGITQSTVATGTLNGIPYVDVKFAGTASSNGDLRISFDANTFVAAAPSQSWTLSAYYALVSGSAPTGRMFRNTMNYRDSGGANIAVTQSPDIASSLTSALQRVIVSIAATPALTAYVHPYFGCAVQIGDVVDFTLRIGAPQLEQKAFATSYIPTSTAAVTRNADALTLSDLTRIGYSASAGTLVAQGVINGRSASTFQAIAALGMGASAADEIALFSNGSTNRFGMSTRVGGVVQFNPSSLLAVAVGTAYKTATAWAVNDAAHTTSGAAPATDTSGSLSTIIDRMSIGGYQALGGGTSGAQTISRIDYYPRRLADAELQTLTT